MLKYLHGLGFTQTAPFQAGTVCRNPADKFFFLFESATLDEPIGAGELAVARRQLVDLGLVTSSGFDRFVFESGVERWLADQPAAPAG